MLQFTRIRSSDRRDVIGSDLGPCRRGAAQDFGKESCGRGQANAPSAVLRLRGGAHIAFLAHQYLDLLACSENLIRNTALGYAESMGLDFQPRQL